jgi:hypothetical protein
VQGPWFARVYSLSGGGKRGPPYTTQSVQNFRRRDSGAIGRLAAGSGLVLLLREIEDLSYKQIAEVTRLPVGTVMSRLSRARQTLRKLWLRETQTVENNTLRPHPPAVAADRQERALQLEIAGPSTTFRTNYVTDGIAPTGNCAMSGMLPTAVDPSRIAIMFTRNTKLASLGASSLIPREYKWSGCGYHPTCAGTRVPFPGPPSSHVEQSISEETNFGLSTTCASKGHGWTGG